MKTNFIILFGQIICLLLGNLSLHAQVFKPHWQSVSFMERVKFVDANVGYMSSSQLPSERIKKATLLKTTNAGADWSLASFDSVSQITAMDFYTADLGFMCMDDKSIRKTTNGGISWSRISFLGFINSFVSIQIMTPQIIYATTGTTFMKSTNGGSSWSSSPIETSLKSFFVNANVGYRLVYTNVLKKTTDAGQSWQNVTLPASTITIPYNGLHFTDQDNGVLVGRRGRVIRTTDGGSSWSSSSMGDAIGFGVVRFVDANRGYMAGDLAAGTGTRNVIYTTTNAGGSWQEQPFDTYFSSISDMSIAGSSGVFVVGAGGKILKTTNQGTQWNLTMGLADQNFLQDVHFVSSRTGHILYHSQSQGNILAKTTDFGKTWISKKIREFVDPMLKSVFFTDSLTGYLAGAQGDIIKTTNGGQSWQSQSSGRTGSIEQIYFRNAFVGFALGGSPGALLYLKTTNGGTSWTQQNLDNINRQLHSIWFASANMGYMAGESGLFLRTSNGGNSWDERNTGIGVSLNSVWFQDENIGYMAGENGAIFKTTNRGNEWSVSIPDNDASLNDMKCLNGICYAVGRSSSGFFYNPVMFRSIDFASNWQLVSVAAPPTPSMFVYKKLYTKSNKQAYLLTDGQTFYEYDAVLASLRRPKATKPSIAFVIYPNPSITGMLNISHNYAHNSQISITNAQGQLIKSIKMDNQIVNLKLENAGLYFVKLENEMGSSTQKVVIY